MDPNPINFIIWGPGEMKLMGSGSLGDVRNEIYDPRVTPSLVRGDEPSGAEVVAEPSLRCLANVRRLAKKRIESGPFTVVSGSPTHTNANHSRSSSNQFSTMHNQFSTKTKHKHNQFMTTTTKTHHSQKRSNHLRVSAGAVGAVQA